jgi:SAM-dependent methyltransferase
MSWRKYMLIPQLTLYALTAPRDQGRAWEKYWSAASRTGADGDVLWDADQASEIEFALSQIRAHADLTLPMVDLGCGNGRQARALARFAPRVIGIDASAAAVARARQETDAATVEFRVADASRPGLGRELAADLGDVNVHIRGMLHIVEPRSRAAIVGNLADMLGRRGTAYLSETNVAGDSLEYLLHQGATPLSMPAVLRRCVAVGMRPPSHFGPAEVAAHFPPPAWQVLASGPTVMYAVPLRADGPLQEIPSHFAVLQRSSG